MLHEFLKENRRKLIEMCGAKAAQRTPVAPPGTGTSVPITYTGGSPCE